MKQLPNWSLRAFLLLAFLFMLPFSLSHALAQDEQPQTGIPRAAGATRDGMRGLRPTREERASWSVPGMDRRIRIHPTDPTDGGNLYWYMHRPLLALVDSEQRYAELPAIVRHIERREDGSATLTFRIVVSTPEFREFCRTLVIQQDKDNIAKAGGREDQVRVWPWPLERMVIDCKVGNTNRVIATGETDNLGSIDDAFDFDLEFSAAALSEFLERAANGTVRFAFSYSFSNREIAMAEADFAVNSMVESALARTLTADQRRGTAVVFQDQANKLKREIQFSISSTVRTTNKDVLPRISPENILAKLLELGEPVDLSQFDEKDPLAVEAAKYVTPLLDKYSVETEAIDKTTDEKEKKKTETFEVELGATVKMVEGKGKYTLENEKRDLLRKEHGVTITETRSADRFAPIKVTVYRVNKDYGSLKFSVADVQFVGMGASSDYLADTPVPLSFTASQLLAKIGQVQAELYVDITPLGAMLPFFGAEPPKGWVWADGKATWPDEKWVPAHLRGKPVPDLTGRIPFGFINNDALGLPTDATTSTKELPTYKLPQPNEGGSRGPVVGLSITPPSLQRPNGNGKKADWSGELTFPIETGRNGSWNLPRGLSQDFQDVVRKGTAIIQEKSLPGPWQFRDEDRTVGGGKLTYSGAELLPPRVNCRWIVRLGRAAPAHQTSTPASPTSPSPTPGK